MACVALSILAVGCVVYRCVGVIRGAIPEYVANEAEDFAVRRASDPVVGDK